MKPEVIIIHHTLTADSFTASWPVIRNYHIGKGYDDIGYHFGIEDLRGHIEILVGRMPDVEGAHCKGHNEKSIGIGVVGNFDIEPPSQEIWEALKKQIRFLMTIFPIKEIRGHRELNAFKTCPGTKFNLMKLRNEVLGGLSGS